VRQVGGLLAGLLIFFFLGRPLIKMLRNKAAARAEQNEALEQQLLNETKSGRRVPAPQSGGAVTLEMIEAAPSYEARATLVRAFVSQDPERAALIVRQLIQERVDAR
jgi:flagellar M-ring protein FliF